MRPTTQTLVIGIGNAWRGDDAAGLLAAHALRARELPGVTVVETNVVDPSLIESWQDVDRLIVVDAVVSGAAPGTVHRFDLSRESLPGGLSFCSSHAFDLTALLNLAQALDRLPPQVWVFGVEAHDFTHGHAVSEAVLLGVTACVETMVGLLDGATARPEN
ncbi:MAG: hydrogenase maturation protease [Caldilinea sp.]